MKNLICQKILSPVLAFIILSCESPAGYDAGDSSEPAAPGYAVFPTGGESSENNEELFTPSISTNSTLRSADWGTTISTAASTALTGAFISGSLCKATRLAEIPLQSIGSAVFPAVRLLEGGGVRFL